MLRAFLRDFTAAGEDAGDLVVFPGYRQHSLGRSLYQRMGDLANNAQRLGHIIGTQKDDINFRDLTNLLKIVQAKPVFAVGDQHSLFILIAEVLRQVGQAVVSSAGESNAAQPNGRVFAFCDKSFGCLSVIDLGYLKAMCASIEEMEDRTLQVVGNTHNWGDAAYFGRTDHIDCILRAGWAMLTVDDDKIHSRKGANFYQVRGTTDQESSNGRFAFRQQFLEMIVYHGASPFVLRGYSGYPARQRTFLQPLAAA